MKALSMFVFAGGFSLGMKRAGFDIAAQLEHDQPYGQEIIDANRRHLGEFPVVPRNQWVGEALATHRLKGIDVLYANPPCAPFSGNNQKSAQPGNWMRDPRVQCIHDVRDVALALKPTIVAFESVVGLWTKAPELVEMLVASYRAAGYSVTIYLHDAQFCGSVQRRKRVMFIAHRVALLPEDFRMFKPKTVADLLPEWAKCKTATPPHKLRANEGPLLALIEPGKSLRDAWERANGDPKLWKRNKRGQVSGRPPFSGYHRPATNSSSSAVVGYPFVHPTEHRLMTIEEYCVMGDFPRSYVFPAHGRTLGYVARGVTPKVGEWLGRGLGNALNRNKKLRLTSFQVWDHRKGGDILIQDGNEALMVVKAAADVRAKAKECAERDLDSSTGGDQ